MSSRRTFTRPGRIAAIAPYLWLALFFLVPFGFVLKISLSQTAIAQPPYLPVFDLTQGWEAIKPALAALSLDNFRLLISDNLYALSYLRSLFVAAVSTSILLVIGYPIAYGMARLPRRWQAVAMMLVIVPFWTSFLIRIYAWINILQHDGLLNQVLLALHLVSTPVVWLSTDSAGVRHPGPAGRFQFHDDRPDAVAGIFHQQGLAGGVGGGGGAAVAAAGAADVL